MKLFHFPTLQKEETSTLLAEEAPTKGVDLGNLDMAFAKLDDDYKFEDLGGCPVPFRASVVRIVFFKLFGTGILAGLIALSDSTDRKTSVSCALAAAVNAIACVHYYLIWKTRAQNMPASYKTWGATVPRTLPDPKRVRNLVFAQETAVDGWRHSDWLCTLVLMTLDLGAIRENVAENTAGEAFAIESTGWLSKEVSALLQGLLIFFGTCYRFYLNEGRGSWTVFVAAMISFFFSFLCFVFILVSLVGGIDNTNLPPWNDTYKGDHVDLIMLQVLVYVWIGYPLVSIVTRVWLWWVYDRKEGDDKHTAYGPYLSMFKDLSYGVLDTTSKGGLALYVAVKAQWAFSR